jgi:hypothetical protein
VSNTDSDTDSDSDADSDAHPHPDSAGRLAGPAAAWQTHHHVAAVSP